MISSSASTTGHAATIAAGSSSTPIDTKKKVLNSSRSGTISPSTLAVRSESASARPATKAPSATLTPSPVGRERRADGDHRHADDEQLARSQPAIIPEQRAAAPRATDDDDGNEAEGHRAAQREAAGCDSSSRLPSADRTTTRTTSQGPARSRRRGRCARSSVVWSASSPATLTRTTVEQTATAAPMKSASISSHPSARPVAVPMVIVVATCTGVPGQDARAQRRRSSRRLNWRPMLNMSSATPMSASARTSSGRPRSPASPDRPRARPRCSRASGARPGGARSRPARGPLPGRRAASARGRSRAVGQRHGAMIPGARGGPDRPNQTETPLPGGPGRGVEPDRTVAAATRRPA